MNTVCSMTAGDYENLNQHRVTSSRTTWMTNSYIEVLHLQLQLTFHCAAVGPAAPLKPDHAKPVTKALMTSTHANNV